MSGNSLLQEIFESLQSILVEYSDELELVKDEPDDFYINTKHIMKNKKAMFFGAVQIKKNYVTFHLMPVYVFPELLSTISSELKHRMQGKSCFNFKSSDQGLFKELSELTSAGYQRYKEAGYV